MGKKNKSKEVLEQVPKVVEVQAKPSKPSVPVDEPVHKLICKTAERNNVSKAVLVDFAVEALLGSIASYGYSVLDAKGNRTAVIGGGGSGTVSLTISKESMSSLNAIGLYFGVKIVDLLRDAILGQRFNWQRLQPVNARTSGCLRLQMFELEQLGAR